MSNQSPKYAVGQEVGYGVWSSLSVGVRSAGFGKIIKINGHGHITVDNGVVFDKHGNARPDTEYTNMVLIAPDYLRRIQADAAQQRIRNNAMNSIITTVKRQTNSRGDICEVPQETKDELIRLVNLL